MKNFLKILPELVSGRARGEAVTEGPLPQVVVGSREDAKARRMGITGQASSLWLGMKRERVMVFLSMLGVPSEPVRI